MAEAVVGRTEQIAAIAEMLADETASARAVLVEGEAGIGKTTLWREGIRLARARGMRILHAQPAESESSLPYGALGDALQDVVEMADDPVRDILRIVLSVSAPDRLTVSRAVLALVREVAAVPVLIAIDDVQRLDQPALRDSRRRGLAGSHGSDARLRSVGYPRDPGQRDLASAGAAASAGPTSRATGWRTLVCRC